jgi:redox-sensitive bicupin YhaK (pirin superfamily)
MPDSVHYDASEMPVFTGDGKTVRLIAGSILGPRTPVRTSSPMFYADVAMQAGTSVPLDPTYDERAIHTITVEVELAGDGLPPGELLLSLASRPGDRITIRTRNDAKFLILGSKPMDGPRFIRWNFVSSRQDRIERAKADPRCPSGTTHEGYHAR